MTTERCTECGESLGLLPRGTLTYLAPIPWGYLWQRSQQFTSRIAPIIPVLYVQPEPLRNLSLRDLGRGFRRLRMHLRGTAGQPPPDGLEVLVPPFLPFAGSAAVDRLNYALMTGAIAQALRRRHPGPLPGILWCTRPSPLAQRLADAGGHRLLVYEMIDPVPAAHPMASRLAAVEQGLIRQADLVVCTSEPLMKRARGLNVEPHLISNGVDPSYFGDGALKTNREARPLSSLPGPIVGFFGTVGDWIDLSLLTFLADHFPQARFVMIGPIELPPHTLPRRRNLHWLGPRAYRDLPSYLSSFSVCLVPFRIDDFTRARNPGKLYEYFATGKPVVSTDLPEVSSFGGLVYVGKDPEGVASALGTALAEEGRIDLIAQRQAVAHANTWDQRVARILHLLHSLTDEPPEGPM